MPLGSAILQGVTLLGISYIVITTISCGDGLVIEVAGVRISKGA